MSNLNSTSSPHVPTCVVRCITSYSQRLCCAATSTHHVAEEHLEWMLTRHANVRHFRLKPFKLLCEINSAVIQLQTIRPQLQSCYIASNSRVSLALSNAESVKYRWF